MDQDQMRIFIEDRPQMIPTKFRFIWPSGFRGEEFKKSANQKHESPVAAMFANASGRNEQILQRTFHRCFLPSFGSFGQAVSEENIFKNRPIRNKNCLWRPCLLMDRDEMTFHRCFLPNFSSFGWGVSEEKIKMWKVNRRQMPSDGKSSHCLWQGGLKNQVR
jgi:hypothetical protein